jgi:hypothetical protein
LLKRQTKRLDPQVRNALVETVVDDVGITILAQEDGIIDQERREGHSNNENLELSVVAGASENDITAEIRAIEESLRAAQEALEESLNKERYIGARLYKYRRLLQDQAEELAAAQRQHEQHNGQSDFDREARRTELDPETGGVDNVDAETTHLQLTPSSAPMWTADEIQQRQSKLEKDMKLLDQVAASHKDIVVACETSRRNIRELQAKRDKALLSIAECRTFLLSAAEARGRDELRTGEDSEGMLQNDEEGEVPDEHDNGTDLSDTALSTAERYQAGTDMEA